MIKGYAVANYRSIGPSLQILDRLERINIIIGKNNSGKSNLLAALDRLLPMATSRETNRNWNPLLDNSRYSRGDQAPTIGLFVPSDAFAIEQTRFRETSDHNFRKVCGHLQEVIGSLAGNGIWVFREKNIDTWKSTLRDKDFDAIKQGLASFSLDVASLNGMFNSTRYMGNEKRNAVELIDSFPTWPTEAPITIPATRSLRFTAVGGSTIQDDIYTVDGKPDYSGLGLIERLFKFQAPDISEIGRKKSFDNLKEFVRCVTNDPKAELQVPHTKTTINLTVDGRTLPLTNYGSGIEQAVIIAAWATVFDDRVLCLEEPETNLHPEYQKKLLWYLQSNTNNQYFVSTHSSSIIDFDGAAIFSVTQTDEGSQVQRVASHFERYSLAFDLGYRASDLAQSNCVVWVEGPSDRILICDGLHNAAQELEEGVHFTIMFYGGRLLSHLSVDDERVDEFILLTRINRRSAIVLDSDRCSEGAAINKTKQRVLDEVAKAGLFAWLTEGREIENYIDVSLAENVVAKITKGAHLVNTGPFDDMCTLETDRGDRCLDKVRFAREVRSLGLKTRLDWDSQIEKLAEFIRQSN